MRGFALPELVIAMLVLGIVLVPLVGVFTNGRLRAGVSQVQYAALVAGRAELEELRQVDFEKLPGLAHGWRPVAGHVFGASVASGAASPTVAKDPALAMPAEYARIETRLAIGDEIGVGVSGLRRATLSLRWQDGGAGHTRAPEALSTFSTVLASHHVVRGVR